MNAYLGNGEETDNQEELEMLNATETEAPKPIKMNVGINGITL